MVPLEFSLYDSYSQFCCAYIIAYTYIFVDSYLFMLKLLLTIRLSEDIYIFLEVTVSTCHVQTKHIKWLNISITKNLYGNFGKQQATKSIYCKQRGLILGQKWRPFSQTWSIQVLIKGQDFETVYNGNMISPIGCKQINALNYITITKIMYTILSWYWLLWMFRRTLS